ncbi:MAG: BREX-6 system phosphatase PglZ [Oculatellaceae cyanobacterium Prado106]|jgi:hypothetical protein|nr:BREX-6 system phosphatase PglZ [Oculatellaceae cyanobacterium Prado106]
MSLIATALEEEIKEKLRHYGIVIWLDKDSHYTAYVDALAQRHAQGTFFAPVIPFRGSYLEMIFALEPYGNGEIPDRLLIHMPGHTEETIRQTPILEFYRAGHRFRKALDTLIREAATGHLSPTQIDGYLSHPTDFAAAVQWLETVIAQPQDDLTDYLEGLNLEWLVEGLLGDSSNPDRTLKSRCENDLPRLIDHLNRHTGIDDTFFTFYLNQPADSFNAIADTCTAWLMCVEYVHDLTRLPHCPELQPLKSLSAPLRKTCDRLLNHLRQRHPDIYAEKAAIVEVRLDPELSAILPEDLGKIDTFQREETAVLGGALDALKSEAWLKALEWAQSRLQADSFWLNRDPVRRLEWALIRDAAILGSTLARVGSCLKTVHTLRDALEIYTQVGYECDRAHRRFEQQRSKLLEPTLPHFSELLETANHLRHLYRTWADELAQAFAQLCEQEGFLPGSDLQQRSLYEQIVHPLTQSNAKVAYFLIDAFRYEMATELIPELEGAGTTVTLKARYAELPTLTAVGMNVLAPVNKSGRLVLASGECFKGFKTGEYTVRTPEDRVRAMGERSSDQSGQAGHRRVRGLSLSEVCTTPTGKLKKTCADANLLVVHSTEIDAAGEANVGLVTFERWLQQIKAAWSHLRAIGVNEFLITADHGFLIQDPTTQAISYGNKRDPSRRHILSADPRSEAGSSTVSLSSLNYEGQSGYLLFRQDTAVFATGNPGASFVHGGNSLQERIIPVLAISHRHPSTLKLVKYQIEAKTNPEPLGCQRLQVRVKPAPVAQGVLSFTGTKQINLSLRVADRPDIEISLRDAPGATISNQQIRVEPDKDWIEILFDLKGTRDERVRIEVYHPDGVEDVDPTSPTDYFQVSGSRKIEAESPEVVISNWQDSFADEGVRQVFLHLQKHGSITESELNQMLGNPRQVRRFAVNFEEYLKQVPFLVKIETVGSGKRYVKHL